MSTEYHFVDKDNCKNNIIVDSAVLVEDGVVWDQGEVQMSLNYAGNDIALIENNNESYLTATDGNDTQYFSVLETSNETTLNDLNDITLYTNGADVEVSDQQDVNSLDEQPSIYAVGTSDDLYAFQIAYDGDGNMQRYRYVLRLNESGLLESVPESVEILPVDQEIEFQEESEVVSEVPEPEEVRIKLQNSDNIVKKEEYPQEFDDSSSNNEDAYEQLRVNGEGYYDESDDYEEHQETKTGLLDQLVVNEVEEASYHSEKSNSEHETENVIDSNSEDIPDNTIESSSANTSVESTLGNFQQVYTLDTAITPDIETTETQDDEVLITRHHRVVEEEEELEEEEEEQEDDEVSCKSPCQLLDEDQFKNNEDVDYINEISESDTEEFEIVDSVHVTADNIRAMKTYIENDAQHAITLQENVLQSTGSKTKNSINNKITNKGNKNLMYYVIKHPEKENVGNITQHALKNKVIKANPRSVLKSSYAFFEQTKDKERVQEQTPKIDKKIVKNRETHQARILHNYIAKTTILHAPVRQERLPRKQTITPVARADEEIIVQEVVVSSNGIIETTENGVVKSKVALKPTEFLQVTDSEEEYDSKKELKRKKKKKKRKSKVPEIIISDSEDGTSDVVQIDLSFESDQEKSEKNCGRFDEGASDVVESSSPGLNDSKRKRGRPKKRLSSSDNLGDTSTSSKKLKSSNDSDLSPSDVRTKWKCNSCPKVFPSQGSLKTHTQYHTYHESSRRKLEFKVPLYGVKSNHKCLICHETFKNNYLLIKHTKEHNEPSKFECGVCRKLFSDQLQLNNHKRSHVKEQMFNSTTLPKHSPKRKSPKFNVPSTDFKYKCTSCTKVFTSSILLNAHLRTHKRFTCLTCTANFISKLALEDHVQNSCVKNPKLAIRRLSFKTKKPKTPVRAVSRRLTLRKSIQISNSEPSSSSDQDKKKTYSVNNLKCDSCSMVFKSHTNLFKHKVLKHGLPTPDKNVKLNKNKRLLDVESRHSSVPASLRLQTAFK